MTAIATHNVVTRRSEDYLYELDRSIRMAKASGIMLKTLVATYSLRRMSRSLREDLRQAIDKCEGNCELNDRCAQKFCEMATSIRDKMLELVNLTDKHTVTAPIRLLMARPVEEWNDFVENCAVAADPEIRTLLDRLSDAV
jgi:hypothetical protein